MTHKLTTETTARRGGRAGFEGAVMALCWVGIMATLIYCAANGPVDREATREDILEHRLEGAHKRIRELEADIDRRMGLMATRSEN